MHLFAGKLPFQENNFFRVCDIKAFNLTPTYVFAHLLLIKHQKGKIS